MLRSLIIHKVEKTHMKDTLLQCQTSKLVIPLIREPRQSSLEASIQGLYLYMYKVVIYVWGVYLFGLWIITLNLLSKLHIKLKSYILITPFIEDLLKRRKMC